MIDEKLIDRWVAEKVVTKKQAARMRKDATSDRKDRTSNKLITVVSTIGALFLGVGAILFIASNWDRMPALVKTLILLVATLATTYAGYSMRYERGNYPRVGASLFFLGALLFGATIFLVAQIYHVNADNHWLILLWLAGTLPLVYAFRSVPVAALDTALVFVWLWFLLEAVSGRWYSQAELIPVTFLLAGVTLFGIGGAHSERFRGVARMYRLGGLKVALAFMFFFTFGWVKEFANDYAGAHGTPLVVVGLLGAFSLALAAYNYLIRERSSLTIVEISASAVTAALTLLVVFAPSDTELYPLLFNVVLLCVIGALFYIGHEREDMHLINLAMLCLAFLVLLRYFDWFWDLLERSVFFMIGGLVLVVGGILMERKRRDLKVRFEG